MEQLRAELSHLLGEKLSRVECVSEKSIPRSGRCTTVRVTHAADGTEFHVTRRCQAACMENVDAGAGGNRAYANGVRRDDP